MLRPTTLKSRAPYAADRNHDEPTCQASSTANNKGRTGKSAAEQAANYELDGTNGQRRTAAKAHQRDQNRQIAEAQLHPGQGLGH